MYKIILQSDYELVSHAITIYNTDCLISKNHALDSSIFGATLVDTCCSICGQTIDMCMGHYAVIKIPFPIPKCICLKDLRLLLPLLCPVCCRLLIPNKVDALKLQPQDRLNWLRKEFEKFNKHNDIIQCQTCKNNIIPIQVNGSEPSIRYELILNGQIQTELSPIYIYHLLQYFSEIDIIGFNKQYHPKDFLTYYIPIVPNKLRLKSINTNSSTLTSFYRFIIENIIPELNQFYINLSGNKKTFGVIPKSISNAFYAVYDKLIAYYLSITDISTESVKETNFNMMNKRDRKHMDQFMSLMGRFKGKDSNIFHKGIIATRVNVSARTVLGGATITDISCLNMPYHIASKLSLLYPVYKQNLKFISQLIASMSDMRIYNDITKPHVLYISFTGEDNRRKIRKITPQTAMSIASLLKAGDKIAISLMDTDFVYQSRFPAVREESWSSFKVKNDNNSIITIPLSVCEMKMADFDGDEAQVYVGNNECVVFESLLLHSTYRQMMAHKNGYFAIWYSADAPYGITQIDKNTSVYIENNSSLSAPKNVLKTIENLIPNDFSYSDDKTIINHGKFGNKYQIDNKDLHKYMYTTLGPKLTENFMNNVIQLAYDINRDNGNTLGFDIHVSSKIMKKIEKIVDEIYTQMRLNEMRSDITDIEQILVSESRKSEIKQLLLDATSGTIMDKLGLVKSKIDEFFNMVVMLDHIVVDGARIQPILSDGTRTCCAYPKNSIDPCAYGFVKNGYDSDISPIAHFYENKQQRFALYQRGQGTAKQGYMSKRLSIAYGASYADYCGMTVNSTHIISSQYGPCGIDPRYSFKLPLIDIDMDEKQFKKKYDETTLYYYRKIHKSFKKYGELTSFTRSNTISNNFISGFDFEQLFNNSKHSNTKTPIKKIDSFIDDLISIYLPDGCTEEYILWNLNTHVYYFRVKLQNNSYDNETLNKAKNYFKWMLVQAGEPIGLKASLSASEPLTQASLHAIHSIGGDVNTERLERSAGLARFEELLSGNKYKNTVITLKLYDDSYESCINFANEQETIYFNDIWKKIELVVSEKLDENISKIHPNIDFSKEQFSMHYAIITINLTKLASFNVHVTEVFNQLIKNYSDVLFITGSVVNIREFNMYVYFRKNVLYYRIMEILNEWKLQKQQTIIHGRYLINCYVYENKNNPGHYLIDANEANKAYAAYQNLIYDERIDPYGCHTTDMEVMLNMYGVCETNARHYEELIYTATNLSVTNGILPRHYKLLSDTTYLYGDAQYANRNSLKHDSDMDILKLVQFETAKDMLHNAMAYGHELYTNDPVSAGTFGNLPTIGTGVSDITITFK